jgi:hypothetical protein
MSGRARSGDAGSGVAGLVGRSRVGWVARGRTGGVGGAGTCTGRSVGRMGFGWSVGLLGPGDGIATLYIYILIIIYFLEHLIVSFFKKGTKVPHYKASKDYIIKH